MDEQNEQRQERAKLRPRQALVGYIDSEPRLTYGQSGVPRLYTRVGVEHFRRDGEDSFVKTGTTFHDMVLFRKTAEEASQKFQQDDRFVAQGYVREFTDQHGNEREEFVATKIGHDMMWTPYTVDRAPQQEAPQREAPGLNRSQAIERDDRPAQQHEPAVMSH
ncbi:single-stranded DNA-binding protein [Brevibacterium ravenspurgense]|uniref:Single-stranded DNA-binding protein n=1 Tax=Brevibacterium ravenspurgense TaxID=479117 RepID=A0A2I1IFK3_9MICO|nr:single-stranded DNA-binding protein [Brevibacterium ravenspurgense]PKY69916.1 single-stranded DNA-binding protein [Brevibacterium ravenspurgense]